ncbi:MAG: 1-acyl-sn-glycerol-3-phosphate acyltransferase [Candidatus Schekmanbacteria bacterium]|nr:1-acyl-sn-glycerol-3-phosphate acyltransferase [Candidatus Schekmanbacteria bacterium]
MKTNLLLLPNHLTMIDNFLIGPKIFYPHVIFKPHLIPWNPAAAENFFNSPVLAWMSSKWKAVPVKRGRKDIEAIHTIINLLREGTVINFPEGTRSRNGKLGKGRPGIGKIIYEAKPTAIPVRTFGMDKVLPIGAYVPRMFKKIELYYGKPIDFSDLYALPDEKETWLRIVDRVMESIEALGPQQGEKEK